MMAQRNTSTQAGFTLLELLVAIMILTLVLTVALGAVRIGNRSFKAGITRADQTAEIRALAGVLRRQLLQLLPVTWNENGRDFIAFEGDEHQLRFVGPAPEGSTGPGYLVYRLGVEPLSGSSRVTLAFAPFDPGSEQFTMPESSGKELLTDSLSDASFEYFGARDERDQPSWHAAWPSYTGRLPSLIRMQLSSSTVQWPDMLFQIHFEAEG
jgi:general secretion pathway protein J